MKGGAPFRVETKTYEECGASIPEVRSVGVVVVMLSVVVFSPGKVVN